MAHFTEDAIKREFAGLLEKYPLSQITVKMICENCEINRKSFYYHYADIPALLGKMVEEDANRFIADYPSFDSIESGIMAALDYVLLHKKAILNISKSLSREVYGRNLLTICDYVVRTYIEETVQGTPLAPEDKELLIVMYRGEIFGLVTQWIMDGMDDSIKELVHRGYSMRQGMTKLMVERLINKF